VDRDSVMDGQIQQFLFRAGNCYRAILFVGEVSAVNHFSWTGHDVTSFGGKFSGGSIVPKNVLVNRDVTSVTVTSMTPTRTGQFPKVCEILLFVRRICG
jgi:hypothetical protein